MAAIFIVSMSPLIVYAQTSFIPLPNTFARQERWKVACPMDCVI